MQLIITDDIISIILIDKKAKKALEKKLDYNRIIFQLTRWTRSGNIIFINVKQSIK